MNKIAEYKRDPRGDFSSRSETGQSQNETRLQQDCYCYCRKCTIECPTRIKVFASEELFSRSNMEWKNCAVCVEIIQINIDKKHSSINANEDQITSGYCCGCRSNSTNPETENCLSPTKVMTCTNRQLANDCCVQSKSAPNDLSKFMITAQEESNFPVVSMPTMAYQDLVVQTNDGNGSSDMQRPPCRFKSYEHSGPLPLATCNNLQFNRAWSTPIHKIAVWSDLYEQFKTRTLARFRHMSENSTSHLRFWTMKRSREITALYYLILLLLIFTSVTNASFAGRRYSTLRNLGLRFPRQSGFRHNIQKPRNQRCEAITVPICRDIGYNQTDMSLSITNKFTQHEAEQELELYTLLINWNCSAELKLFLCSIYTPICMEHYGHFLPPCRFICERAKNGCLPIIHLYDYKWPEKLRCEQFPTYAGKHPMCMHFNLTRTKEEEVKIFNSDKFTEEDVNSPKSTSETKTRSTTRRPPKSTKAAKTRGTTPIKKTTTKPRKMKLTTTTATVKTNAHVHHRKFSKPTTETSDISPVFQFPNSSMCTCQKPMVYIRNPQDPMYNRVATGGVPNCAVSCKSPYFTKDQIMFSEMWIKCWSIVCFVVTLMTVSTFLIDMRRFKYPERPIIFLSTCYMFVSIGFLIRIVAGHEAVACAHRTDHVLYHTTGPVLCTTVFLLVYFFSMASALWWVILAMTWFLAAGLKWGSEAIEKYSQYYHAAAWLIPSLKSIMVLAMSSVDGDSLSGICFVGNQDVRALRGFVLAPLVVYLLLGGMFLLAGFISLFRIRNRIKKGGTKTDNLEKLMGRIGIFSVLYMVPAAALVACYFYEQKYRPMWEYSHNCRSMFKTPEDANVPQLSFVAAHNKYSFEGPIFPEFIVFMVRYLMTLLIGITNGVWICSPKTLTSWKGFYRRCVCCLNGAPCPPPCGKDIFTAKPSVCGDSRNQKGHITAQKDHKIPCKSTEGNPRIDGDNRSDSFRLQKHDLSKIEYDQNEFQINSECRKSSSSRQVTSSKCEVCDRSSRSSSNNSRTSKRKRKRRSRSRTPIENYCDRKETARVRPTGMEKDESHVAMICNNTTSTDGSDRLFFDDPNLDEYSQVQRTRCCCACNPHLTTESNNTYTRQSSHSSGRSKTTKIQDCRVCNKTLGPSSEKLISNGQSYVINDDNLPPCILQSCGSVTSYNFCSQKSAPSSHATEFDEDEVQETLLNHNLGNETSNDTTSPYYHYHHHHYNSKPES